MILVAILGQKHSQLQFCEFELFSVLTCEIQPSVDFCQHSWKLCPNEYFDTMINSDTLSFIQNDLFQIFHQNSF